jgi:formamidopyrimidine-DNA glycosylase
MPELPEVETTRLGILPAIEQHIITAVRIHQARLRWPVPPELSELVGQRINTIQRRGKYLIFTTATGHVLLHLGMSGSLRLTKASEPLRRHDHIELDSDSGWTLRFHDPRRFGCVLWFSQPPEEHPLLATLGPEPLEGDFSGHYLFQRSRGRSAPIKSFLMDSHMVVGVGNIYANEALFHAGIHPLRAAGRISEARYEQLAIAIRQILSKAIQQGGTTLRDFVNSQGEPGYFQQALDVYGRSGQPCHHCRTPLKEARLSGRSTVYCPQCQR